MRIKPGSKYYPLYQRLRRSGEARLVLPFDELESILGLALPPSARRGRAFWSNRSRGAHQAMAWMEAGYHVEQVDLEAELVVFVRPVIRYQVRKEGQILQWDGRLVQALRAHMGLSQSELAEILGVRQQTISEWETGVYTPTRARGKHLMLVAERAGFEINPAQQGQQEIQLDN